MGMLSHASTWKTASSAPTLLVRTSCFGRTRLCPWASLSRSSLHLCWAVLDTRPWRGCGLLFGTCCWTRSSGPCAGCSTRMASATWTHGRRARSALSCSRSMRRQPFLRPWRAATATLLAACRFPRPQPRRLIANQHQLWQSHAIQRRALRGCRQIQRRTCRSLATHWSSRQTQEASLGQARSKRKENSALHSTSERIASKWREIDDLGHYAAAVRRDRPAPVAAGGRVCSTG
mmetsp:Transcript_416/g.828  ORF Transcript_416/g.828 Transcript_416/m.828 type:complete len:233 (-) Transcript_416:494-1192(-)